MKFTIRYQDDNSCEIYSVGIFDTKEAAVEWLRETLLPQTVGCDMSQGAGWMTIRHPYGSVAEFVVHPLVEPAEFMANWNVGDLPHEEQTEIPL